MQQLGVFRKQQLGTNQVAACDIQWLQGVGRCLDVAGCVRMARLSRGVSGLLRSPGKSRFF